MMITKKDEKVLNNNEDKIRETLRGQLERSYSMAGSSDVLKWVSNDRCIPHDIMLNMKRYGLVTERQCMMTRYVEQEQINAFLDEWKENRKNRSAEQVAEEQFEMRAAFGPGETVVNVVTGERTKL